jgi:hypothetical protein
MEIVAATLKLIVAAEAKGEAHTVSILHKRRRPIF